MDAAPRKLLVAVATILEALLAGVSAYLLTLLAAALRARVPRATEAVAADGPRHVVLVPAHDEEALVGRAVASLRAIDFPSRRHAIYVIADNCRDRTAQVAEAAGARVLVRDEPTLRGKGHALAWALSQAEIRESADVVVVVDADCLVSPNLLAAIDARVREGAQAVQVAYLVANPDAGTTAALRFAGFALVNYVRPLGRSRLGCSAGLLGSGFAITRGTLERQPWDAHTLAEDREYHALLVLAGCKVQFAPEAAVRSEMPTSRQAALAQNLRWEAGKRTVARRFGASLVRAGLRRRDGVALEAAVESVVPPQSALLAANATGLAVSAMLRAPRTLQLACLNVAAQVLYVLGGLAVAHAPAAVYRALLDAPRLVVWKLGLLLRRAPAEWVGTREPVG